MARAYKSNNIMCYNYSINKQTYDLEQKQISKHVDL